MLSKDYFKHATIGSRIQIFEEIDYKGIMLTFAEMINSEENDVQTNQETNHNADEVHFDDVNIQDLQTEPIECSNA